MRLAPLLVKLAVPVASVLLLVELGCGNGTSPGADLPYVSATRSCGPADGPQTVIDFNRDPPGTRRVDPVFPYVFIVIDRSLAGLVGTWSVSPSGPEANAVYAPNLNTRLDGVGSITVTRVAADDTVVGRMDILFGAQHAVREFTAAWVPSTVACG